MNRNNFLTLEEFKNLKSSDLHFNIFGSHLCKICYDNLTRNNTIDIYILEVEIQYNDDHIIEHDEQPCVIESICDNGHKTSSMYNHTCACGWSLFPEKNTKKRTIKWKQNHETFEEIQLK